jgi:CrcB protein
MIRLERVAHAEQGAEPGARHEFENWHNGSPTFYVNLLLIAIGGAIGSTLRYLLSSFVLRASGSLFPIGTAVVNLVGCIVFGVIVGASEQRVAIAPETRTFLLIGVLGGFTTFSSYAYESFVLLRDAQFAAAGVNIVGQVIAGLVGVWIGYVAAH